jgi:exopolysaccharide production protein ExoZ
MLGLQARMTVAKPSLDRINNVQALRGFAALLVVFGHTEFALPGMRAFGTFGVDIFFVISGFIMAMILDRNPQKFFLRRLIRILPLYWAATFGVWLLAAWKPQWMMHTSANWHDLLLSLLFIPFFKNGGADPRPVLFVGWTLNYEMFFYVVLAVCLRVTRTRTAICASALMFAIMLACRFSGLHSAWAQMYGNLLVMEFVLGMAAYWLVSKSSHARAHRLLRPAAALASSAALLMVLLQGVDMWPYIWVDRLYLFGLPSFVLVASAALLSKAHMDTRSRLLVLLGDASYVMYILHSYVLDGFDRLLGPRVPWLHIYRPVGCVVSIALVIAISILLYLYAERPAVDWLSVKFGTRNIPRAEVKDPATSMA